jgi:hypothetical protein
LAEKKKKENTYETNVMDPESLTGAVLKKWTAA